MSTTTGKKETQQQRVAKRAPARGSEHGSETGEGQQTEQLPALQSEQSAGRETRVLQPLTTRPLEQGPVTVTRPLQRELTTTTGRQAIRIPAAKNVRTKTQATKKRSPFVLIGVCLGILLIFGFSAFFVNPLASSAQINGIGQTLNSFFGGNDSSVVQLSERQASPTATLALQTNEGYCGGYDIWGTCARALTPDGSIGTGIMQRPLQGAIVTQPFGNPEYQFWCGCVKPHTGIDLAAAYGAPITAADDGQVIWVGWDWSGLGNAVKISHGNYIATIYGHLARYVVKVGDKVSKGQVIAYEGNTGASTGPHLHFMVMVNNKWVDPTLYMVLP